MMVSTIAIVSGNILVLIFSDHADYLLNSRQVVQLYISNTAYHIYIIFAGVIWLIFHIVFRKYHYSQTVLNVRLWHHEFIEPLSFSISSALIGTQAVLNAKCMSMFIQVSVQGFNEFIRPAIYIILVIWLMLVVYWLKRLDLGLELFPPMFIIPVLQVFYMFFAIVCGGIFFEEFNDFTTIQTIGFSLGVFTILVGVYGLAPTNSSNLTGNKVSEEIIKHVVLQIEEVPEIMTSFRKHYLDPPLEIAGRKVHPVTSILRNVLYLPNLNEDSTSDDNKEDKSIPPALIHFRKMSLKAIQEREEFKIYDSERGIHNETSLFIPDDSTNNTSSIDILDAASYTNRPVKLKEQPINLQSFFSECSSRDYRVHPSTAD
jgi:hypothetical protein